MKSHFKNLRGFALLTGLVLISLPSMAQSGWKLMGNPILGDSAWFEAGKAVGLSGDGYTLAVGSPDYRVFSNGAGQVKVYSYDGSNWVLKGAQILGQSSGGEFGNAVALSEDGATLIAGEYLDDNSVGGNAGSVRAYSWSGSSWQQKGTDIDGEVGADWWGKSVAVSNDGNRFVAGAPLNDGNGNEAGHARVYSFSNNNWAKQGTDINGLSSGDYAGWSVSCNASGNSVVLGNKESDGNGVGSGTGEVRVYGWTGSLWLARGSAIYGISSNEKFGNSVSMSDDGNTIAVGAPINNAVATAAGEVRIYSWGGTNWVQKGASLQGDASGDQFGYSVSLSADGNTVAIGAHLSNVNLLDCGFVRVFRWSGSAWMPLGNDIKGDSLTDELGSSVSISSDGNTVAVGMPGNDGNGLNSGQARVYTCNSFNSINPQACYFYTLPNGNTVTSSGIYYDTLINALGCDSFLTINLTVTIPDTSVTPASGSLTANAATGTYRWLDCNNNYAAVAGETAAVFSPGISGTYALEITQNFCIDTSSCYQVWAVGLDEPISERQIKIVPNPNHGTFDLELPQGFSSQGLVRVFDASGQMIESKISSGIEGLRISLDAAPGIYLIHFISEEGREIKSRLLIQ